MKKKLGEILNAILLASIILLFGLMIGMIYKVFTTPYIWIPR